MFYLEAIFCWIICCINSHPRGSSARKATEKA